jgi:hypothetical protein
MQPSLQQDTGDADTQAMPTDPNDRQRVAVFSEYFDCASVLA